MPRCGIVLLGVLVACSSPGPKWPGASASVESPVCPSGKSCHGGCVMDPMAVEMVWVACAPGLDCTDTGSARMLHTPARGPVVKEAHLATDQDGFDGWPKASRHRIARHHALSQAASCFGVMRGEPWAPAGEGGCEYGQGSTGRVVPVLAEAWYVTMFWRTRPPPGTRMLIVNPENGRAVVAAGGYETGPGSNTAVAGAVEEVHAYLGTSHRDPLLIGFAADQSLPYGPIDCSSGMPIDMCDRE